MRTVVSVSMSPEMATRLKSSAAERGQSFSARVCELLEAGELHEVLVERMDEGLFASTEEGSVEQESEEVEAETPHKSVAVKTGRTPLPAPAQLFTVTERVYACVTTEKTSVREIAEQAGVSEVEAGEVLERLIDQDGEPIVLSRSGGDWVCWIEAVEAA